MKSPAGVGADVAGGEIARRPFVLTRWPAFIFGLVVLAIFGAAYLAFDAQQKDIKTRAERNLADIAQLKVNQISNWLAERKADAAVFSNRTPFAQMLDDWLREGRQDNAERRRLRARMDLIANHYDYQALIFVDPGGQAALSTQESATIDGEERELALEAMRTAQMRFGDIHADAAHRPTMGVVAPMFVGEGEASRLVGALYFRIDPERFLFRLIRSWPIESETAETILVRREGDKVRFLSHLRHSDSAPMSFHASVADPDLLAAQFCRGKIGFAAGADYRGHKVVGYLTSIPDTQWGVVAKIDEAEIYAPIRRLALYTVIVFLVLLALAANVFISLRARALYVQQRYQAEVSSRILAQRAEVALRLHELITQNMQEGLCLVRSNDGTIVFTNPRFDAMFGYDAGELAGRPVSSINAPTEQSPDETALRIVQALERDGKWSGDVMNIRKDGTTFWCNAAVSTFEHPEHGKVWLAAHLDITERKRLEDAQASHLERIRELSHRLVATQENERRKLGAELHDRTAANLATMNLLLKDLAEKLPCTSDGELAHAMEDFQALMADTNATIRDISTDLHPPLLHYLGLDAALSDLAGRFAQRLGIEIHVHAPGALRPDGVVHTALYRIAQEALTNCAKHAACKSVNIDLAETDDGIVLTVVDDGVGFVPDAVAAGLGIATMRERIELAGGRFHIDSVPGRGTAIRAEFPSSASVPQPVAPLRAATE